MPEKALPHGLVPGNPRGDDLKRQLAGRFNINRLSSELPYNRNSPLQDRIWYGVVMVDWCCPKMYLEQDHLAYMQMSGAPIMRLRAPHTGSNPTVRLDCTRLVGPVLITEGFASRRGTCSHLPMW
jgi:hypothetical protein